MPSRKSLFTGSLLTFLIAASWYLLCATPISPSHTPSPSTPPTTKMPPNTRISISISDSQSPSSDHPPSIHLTLTLPDPPSESTVTFLAWDTPFEPSFPTSGNLHIRSLDTGELIEIPRIMKNRLPPKREDLVEIAKGECKTVEVRLGPPIVEFRNEGNGDGEGGKRRFGVRVKGLYRGFWEKRMDEVSDEELEMAGGLPEDREGVVFESEEVVVEV